MEKFPEKHPLHLKQPELQKSEEVQKSVEKHERLNDEKLPNEPTDRIEAHMDRLEKIFLNKNEDVRKRNIEMLKPAIYNQFIIKRDEVPEKAFILEQQIARRLGHGDVEITEEFRQRKTEQIINDQKHSLDRWIDYLTSNDATYPTWSKYLAMTSVLKMGGLKKQEDEQGREKAIFKKRKKETVASFPPLNARALALTISVLEKQLKRDGSQIDNKSTKLNDQEFQKLAQSENFSKIYAQFLVELPEYSTEGLKEIRGEWVKYEQDSDPEPLVKSLDGYPLEWCTANPDTAKSHLEGGDFYVYYSLDQDGNAKIPRLAIRMKQDNIAEVRGIAPDQNTDPYITPVLDEKMKDFGSQGEKYKKKTADMKQLTEIDNKIQENPDTELSKEELKFLYEIDSSIEGFGYEKDPRIEEILNHRNIKEDLSSVLDCRPDQISTTKKEALSGGILFHHGSLDLNGLTSAEGLTLPETINGGLYLNSLTSAEGLKLPETINGYLDLRRLTSAEGLKLPETINGDLNLESLTSAEGLTLPETINGDLYLDDLTSADIQKLREQRPDLADKI